MIKLILRTTPCRPVFYWYKYNCITSTYIHHDNVIVLCLFVFQYTNVRSGIGGWSFRGSELCQRRGMRRPLYATQWIL